MQVSRNAVVSFISGLLSLGSGFCALLLSSDLFLLALVVFLLAAALCAGP